MATASATRANGSRVPTPCSSARIPIRPRPSARPIRPAAPATRRAAFASRKLRGPTSSTMSSWPIRRRNAFTLLEVLVALVVVALLASGLAMPLAAQLQQRRTEEARRQLEEAKEALLGFAAAHGR